MLCRELRSLNLLNQDKRFEVASNQTQNFKGSRTVNLAVGDIILAKNYKNPMKLTWEPALIKEKLSEKIYLCRPLNDLNSVMKRHADQILKALTIKPQNSKVINTSKQPKNVLQWGLMRC